MNHHKLKFFFALFLLCAVADLAMAKVKLPAVIGNGMVLQQQSQVKLWGTSTGPGVVKITTSWNGRRYSAQISQDGKWSVNITTPAAGGPYEVIINDGEELKLTDILIGEVWLVSGQSNMDMPVKGFKNQPVLTADEILKHAANPGIRLFRVIKEAKGAPAENLKGSWERSDSASVSLFSAVGYLYALALQKKLNVPVGIIQSSWGGTGIASWMSAEALKGFDKYPVKTASAVDLKDRNAPSALFNGMIAPLIGYGIKGVLWYQGEHNHREPELYAKMFPKMISDWRERWGIGAWPFYYVQLAPVESVKDGEHTSLSALFREMQFKSQFSIPNTAMSVTLDAGEQKVIHPANKPAVAQRLAAIALNRTYGFKQIPCSGPIYKNMKSEAGKILLKFDGADGLRFSGNESVNFEIAGDDRVFYPAKAVIAKKGIQVYSDKVSRPVAVRYAFKAWAAGDLFNKDGFPASSFRTDSWEQDGHSVAQQKDDALESGRPMKNGSATGTGRFALPSLTGMVMGLAQVDADIYPDLFVQADKRNPGTFLYHFKNFSEKGEPVFSEGIRVGLPFEDTGSRNGVILQHSAKEIYGFWRFYKTLKVSKFDKATNSFHTLKTINVKGIPGSFSTFGVLRTSNNRYLFLFTVNKEGRFSDPSKGADSSYYTPEGFWPFELPAAGIYGAFADDVETLDQLIAKPLTGLDETLYGFNGYTWYQNKEETFVLAGTRLGNIHAYPLDEKKEVFAAKKYLTDSSGIILRQPVVNSYPGYFSAPGSRAGLIMSGEGGIFFYENTGAKDKNGNPVFRSPVSLMQQKPLLYGGSLVVPELYDWDGDGLIDILSGASSGNIMFFKNKGTNAAPAYESPSPLKAGGQTIHVQPGYREDIQGPGEARWGYTCPAVCDWNGDGLPDILTGDSRGKFMVYINIGTKTRPVLAAESPLYINGMNLYGGWRSKPGVARLGDKMAYVITDRDNDFHLYWQLDTYNLTDGGKLTIGDSVAIKAHRRKGGQVGRAKIHIVDWDQDGVKDLLIGTGRGASIPNPVNGLPYNRKVKNEGAAVLFLRNSGSDSKPVFEFPKMMKYKGKEILLGAHECGPTTAYIGDGNTLNLVVGTEYGTFMYYERKDLSW